jgi:superoxide dismutase
LKDTIDKHFTDFNGFKEAFKKVVQSRFLPGWVWLGTTGDGKLIITQTNN